MVTFHRGGALVPLVVVLINTAFSYALRRNRPNVNICRGPSPAWFRLEPLGEFLSPGVLDMLEPDAPIFNSPLFPDLDGDGSLEYFYNNHYSLFNGGWANGTYVYGKFGTSDPPVVLPLSVNFTLTDDVYRGPRLRLGSGRRLKEWEATGNHHKDIWLEEQYGLHDDSLQLLAGLYPHYYDSHGGFIADLDDDGHPDLYMANGAGNGVRFGPQYASVLYWGAAHADGSRWTLAGGSQAAVAARLENHGGSGRGRFAYLADFDGDGLLDVLTVNEQRRDALVTPSQVLYNNGDRTFTADPSFAEYVNLVILGNNWSAAWVKAAHHLIIQRGVCDSQEQEEFCRTHKEKSWVVYKYKGGKMTVANDLIDPIGSDTHEANHIQAEDINDDQRLDYMVVSGTIKLYYSKPNKLTITKDGHDEEIEHPWKGLLLRAAVMRDFDLDGNMDIYAIYQNTNAKMLMSVMYTKIPGATAPPFYQQTHRHHNIIAYSLRHIIIKDIAAVDYNDDGHFDIVLSSSKQPRLFHLTYNFRRSGCPAPNFLAVTLAGDPARGVNRYGIGATLRLVAWDTKQTQPRYFLRSVSSYSHGTTNRGGAEDYRLVFGLGFHYWPAQIVVFWPNGEWQLFKQGLHERTNSMTEPLTLKYAPPQPVLGDGASDGASADTRDAAASDREGAAISAAYCSSLPVTEKPLYCTQ